MKHCANYVRDNFCRIYICFDLRGEVEGAWGEGRRNLVEPELFEYPTELFVRSSFLLCVIQHKLRELQ